MWDASDSGKHSNNKLIKIFFSSKFALPFFFLLCNIINTHSLAWYSLNLQCSHCHHTKYIFLIAYFSCHAHFSIILCAGENRLHVVPVLETMAKIHTREGQAEWKTMYLFCHTEKGSNIFPV